MDDFSVWDQVRACIPCAKKPDIDSDDDLEARDPTRPELDRLLFDSEHDATDVEADALSLHSSFGPSSSSARAKSKKRRRRNGKSIRIFGYDLFGRPHPPETSPSHSEDESSALGPNPQLRRPRSTSSSAQLDPDATPLPDEAIATLASPHANDSPHSHAGLAKWTAPLTDEQIALEEEQQKAEDERLARKAARRLRKQQKAEAAAAAAEAAAELAAGLDSPLAQDDAPEFEGFPGGNATLATDASQPHVASSGDGEYGPWIGGSQPSRNNSLTVPGEGYASDDDEVDVGGEYNRKSKASSRSGSGDGSSSKQSRSRHSHSSSVVDGTSSYASRPRRNYHTRHESLASPYNVPLPPSSAGSSVHGHELSYQQQLPPFNSKKRLTVQSRSSAARSQTSSSTSPSTPLRSPLGQDVFVQQAPGVGVDSHFGEEIAIPDESQNEGALSTNGGFPSTGFGGFGGKRGSLANSQGAAFARGGW
ncbi:hypothetical protein DL93DRAFT_2225593 [Clavulina sp. PMI_390]|nr:hypothetical protein DL93DRAFT_2225593 [Clavulina sp. PMI_390]